MKYILTHRQKALDIGINPVGHFKKGDQIILNENEVIRNPHLNGDLDARVKTLDAKLYTPVYTKRIIKTEHYAI